MPLDMFVSLQQTICRLPCLRWQGKDSFNLEPRRTGKRRNLQSKWQRVIHNKPHLHRIPSVSCSGTANKSPQVSVSSRDIPASAREAVQDGQQAFDQAEYGEALRLFSAAMTLRPNDDEARAALYNGACAKVKLKDWQGAADDVSRAVNDYKLRLDVAMKVRIPRIRCQSIARNRIMAPGR